MFIDIQKISGGKVLAGGKVYIGPVDDNPIDNPIPVFSDYDFTTPISTPLFLDDNGIPKDSTGAQVNLYYNANFSIQLQDKYGANFYLTAPIITV